MLYAATIDDIEVSFCGVRYSKPDGSCKDCSFGLIRCAPDSVATIYNINISISSGLEKVASASAQLKGMAEYVKVSDLLRSTRSVFTSFRLNNDTELGNTLRGFTSGLGSASPTEGITPPFELTLILKLHNGKIFSKTIDVSTQVVNSKNPHNVFIDIDGVEVPDDGSPDEPHPGGFEAGVNGWKEVIIDL